MLAFLFCGQEVKLLRYENKIYQMKFVYDPTCSALTSNRLSDDDINSELVSVIRAVLYTLLETNDKLQPIFTEHLLVSFKSRRQEKGLHTLADGTQLKKYTHVIRFAVSMRTIDDHEQGPIITCTTENDVIIDDALPSTSCGLQENHTNPVLNNSRECDIPEDDDNIGIRLDDSRPISHCQKLKSNKRRRNSDNTVTAPLDSTTSESVKLSNMFETRSKRPNNVGRKIDETERVSTSVASEPPVKRYVFRSQGFDRHTIETEENDESLKLQQMASGASTNQIVVRSNDNNVTDRRRRRSHDGLSFNNFISCLSPIRGKNAIR